MSQEEGRMTMSELRAQIINLLQDAWELGFECGAKDISSARTVTLDDMADTELAEHGLVRLPVDADGVTWTGGEYLYKDRHGDTHACAELVLHPGGWMLSCSDGVYHLPEDCRHADEPADEPEPADTPASLADELDGAVWGQVMEPSVFHKIRNVAYRLRAIGGGE